MNRSRTIFLGLVILLGWGCDREDPEIEEHIAGNRIASIYIDIDGTRWFGTENGLSAYDGSSWTNYTSDDGLPDNGITDICARLNENGSELVIASSQGAGIAAKVSHVIHSVSQLLSSNSGLAGDQVSSLTHDNENTTWFGTDGGVSIQNEDGWMNEEQNELTGAFPITAIAAGPDTISFVALAGKGIALMEAGVDAITTVTLYQWPFSPLPSDNVQAICVHGYHRQWIGTDKGLAFHGNFDPKQQWELFYERDGLINNNVLSIADDGSGLTWIGTAAGVSSFDGSVWTNYRVEDGLAGDSVLAIALEADGSVWFGTNSGASHFDGESWTTFRKAETVE